MYFQLIDYANWKRKSHYEGISQKDPSLINMTVSINITDLKKYLSKHSMRLYPFLIACISMVINKFDEFKMAFDENSNLGVYDIVHPSYTIFHKEDCTFSCIYTVNQNDIDSFYNAVIRDMEIFGSLKGFETRTAPKNSFPISCIPWITYTGYSVIELKEKMNVAPYIIIGRYFYQNSEIQLPVTMQVSHSVADGYHVCMFFQELQKLLNSLT